MAFKAVKGNWLKMLAAMVLLLTACAHEPYDADGSIKREEYENLAARRGEITNAEEPPIPALKTVLASPNPPKVFDGRKVTINVSDDTPIKDVLIEIARKSELDLELDPNISGGVVFSAYDRPLTEVIERICGVTGLRYRFKGNSLRVEMDTPYLENYRLDALNLRREAQSSVGATTDVFSAVGGGGGGSTGGNASTTQLNNQTTSNLWDEINNNIERILSVSPATTQLAAISAQISTAPQMATNNATATENAAQALAQVQQTIGQDGAPPDTVNPPRNAVVSTATTAMGDGAPTDYFTINRQAGIISVYTTEKQHKKITEYLNEIKRSVSTQVLIEAKIVEVKLNKEFRSGINWEKLTLGKFNFSLQHGGNVVFPPISDNPPTLTLRGSTGGRNPITALIDVMDQFGTVRTLSSPRLTVMNNQVSLLKVAENEVYFSMDIEREDLDNGTSRATFTSTMNTVPIGLIMTVQPVVNQEQGQITLSLRPTISRVARRVSDPAVALTAADLNVNVESLIPVVEVREMDSVITLASGEVMVMGGLMQERVSKTENEVPKLGRVPVLGNAFKAKEDNTEVIELVVFLKATVVKGKDSISSADKDIYTRFAPDPRPVTF